MYFWKEIITWSRAVHTGMDVKVVNSYSSGEYETKQHADAMLYVMKYCQYIYICIWQ